MFQRRLSLFLTRIAPLALSACALGPLNEEACLTLDETESVCPSAAAAADELVGREVCDTPVRKVVRTGVFLHSEEVSPYYYGSGYPDTGATETVTQCCYEARYRNIGGSCVIGRPLLEDGHMIRAAEVTRGDWSAPIRPALSGLSDAAREALAEAWTETGLLEHASVPAFARLILELTALGAPPDLVTRANEALADEIRHANAAFALASAYAGRPVGPGALSVPPLARTDLVALAVATFREACVGETIAVAIAAAQRHATTDPAVRSVLDTIVADESRHAALGWDIVRWALAQGGDDVRDAIRTEIAAVRAPQPTAGVPPRGCAAHGLADPALVAAASRAVVSEVVVPEAEALLG